MARGQRKVRPGEKLKNTISATTWNSMIDALGWIENFKRNDKHQERESRDGIVQAKNESGIGFSQFDVAALRDILFSPTDNLSEYKNNYAFRSAVYASGDTFKWGICQQPTAAGAIGPVAVAGPTIARINVSDADHTHAKPTIGVSSQLESATSGAKILWKESGTGEQKWAVILLPEGGGGESLNIFKFTLYQDRQEGGYAEKLPCILENFSGVESCNKPASNTTAEQAIAEILDLDYPGNWPEGWNAQFIWFDDDVYPFARGPMEAGDGGNEAAGGALGFCWFDPSIPEDDDAENCSKRFRVLVCDQRAMFFQTQAKFAFPYADDIGSVGSNLDGNNAGDNGTHGDEYFLMGTPIPLGQWPFSQREHSDYWDPYPDDPAPNHTSIVTNPLRYCGASGDKGIITYKPEGNSWVLVSTQVRNVTALGDLIYEDCSIKARQKRFRAYSRADGGEWSAEYEVELPMYAANYATGAQRHQIYAADGVSPPVGDNTDICVVEAATQTACFFTEEGAASWVATGVEYSRIEGMKDVTVGTDVTFSRYYVWQPACTILNRSDVTIEGTTECPP